MDLGSILDDVGGIFSSVQQSAGTWNTIQAGLNIAGTLYKNSATRSADSKNNTAVGDNMQLQESQLGLQSSQELQQSGQQQSTIARMAGREQGRVAAVTGEYGVNGNSASRLSNEVSQNENDNLTTLNTNTQNYQAQNNLQRNAAQVNANARMIAPPSTLGLMLQLGGNLANFGSQLKPPTYTLPTFVG